MPDASRLPPFPSASSLAPLARVVRGDEIDADHLGVAVAVDRDGRIVASAGDPDLVVASRSALKPLQAMPFAAAGGIERFGLSQPQVALLCASHSGEPRHVEAVADLLQRAGCTAADLQCGSHAPGYHEVRHETPSPPPYSPLAHNCSGKHAGMLAWCVACGAPKASYLAFDHPLQQAIRKAVSHFTGVAERDLRAGVDGCSAPNYAMPLSRLALAFARLASDEPDPVYGGAPLALAQAMRNHPEMVSGEGRNDLALTRAGRGDWIAKIGAEGVQAIGVRSAGLGIVVKVADGHRRALMPAVVAMLDQLGLLDDAQRAMLDPWRAPELRNYRGLVTGRIEPVVVLDRGAGFALRQSNRAAVAPR